MDIIGYLTVTGLSITGLYKLYQSDYLIVIKDNVEPSVIYIYNNPITKNILYIYCLASVISFSTKTYNDGKLELIKHRINGGVPARDFQVTLNACKRNMTDNFLDSIFLPWNIVSNVFPYFILFMNKRK